MIRKLFILYFTITSLYLISAARLEAAPTIDTLEIQGFMRKADGSPVSSGNYDLVFGVFQGGSAIWAKRYSDVPVSNGLFSQVLSGQGADLSQVPLSTGMNSDFSNVTLGPTLLQNSTDGAVLVRIYAAVPIDGRNPQFDVTLNSVPSCFNAAVAQRVGEGTISLSSMASGLYSQSSSPLKLVQLTSSGKLDPSVYGNDIPASQIAGVIASAQLSIVSSDLPIVPISKGGTGRSTAGSAHQLLGMNAAGSALEYKSLTAGSNITITQSIGGLTISAAGGSAGTVTEVVAGAGLTGGTITTSGTLAVNAGTGANQIVQLDSSARLPAVNGSQLTSLSAANLSGSVPTGVLPEAGATSSGIVNQGAQTLAGDKTFAGTTTMGGATVLSSVTVASGGPTPYNGTAPAKVFGVTRTLTFLTGTSATSISCMSPGVVGQIFYLVARDAIGTGLTIVNNATCLLGAKILTNTNTNISSTIGSSRAAFGFVYSGTEWVLFSLAQ